METSMQTLENQNQYMGNEQFPGQKSPIKKKKKKFGLVFCIGMMAWPIIQWLVFYLIMNFDGILLAFQTWQPKAGGEAWEGKFVYLPWNDLFRNFKDVIKEFTGMGGETNLLPMLGRGALLYLLNFVITTVSAFTLAFLIYKKCPGHKFIYIITYLPSIIAGVIIAMYYQLFIEKGIPLLFDVEFTRPFYSEWNYLLVFGFSIFMGMPGGLLINVASMSNVPQELVESGKMDGLTIMGEFIHIVLPLIYPIISVGMLGFFVGMFTFSGPLYTFYGEHAADDPMSERLQTVGYYLYTKVIGTKASKEYYGYTAAQGLLQGAISVPLIFLMRWILLRFDPEAEV